MASNPNLSQSNGRQQQSASAIPEAQLPMHFDGPEYIPARDQRRLSGQILRIFDLMRDGKWRSLPEIARATGDPEASISSQLRHLRKPRFGSHTVEREHRGNGLFAYRLIVRKP